MAKSGGGGPRSIPIVLSVSPNNPAANVAATCTFTPGSDIPGGSNLNLAVSTTSGNVSYSLDGVSWIPLSSVNDTQSIAFYINPGTQNDQKTFYTKCDTNGASVTMTFSGSLSTGDTVTGTASFAVPNKLGG